MSPLASSTPAAVRRIGYLYAGTAAAAQPFMAAFDDRMRELGWADGENLVIEQRYAGGRAELLSELAADLVQLPVEVILAHAAIAIVPAARQTSTIPIVMVSGPDQNAPAAPGLVQTLARPSANITGNTTGVSTGVTKSVELLKTALPQLSRVAFLDDWSTPSYADIRPSMAQAAPTLNIQVLDLDVRTAEDVDRAFEAALAWRAEGLYVAAPATYTAGVYARVSELAARNHMPAMYGSYIPVATDGGLMAFTSNQFSAYRQAAEYVDKILRGASPADLPIQEPRQFDFVVNVNTAQQLGITFPTDAAAQVTQWVQQ
jgi:putative ABC transport system substrate-binding protein